MLALIVRLDLPQRENSATRPRVHGDASLRRRVCGLVAALALAGCATTPAPPQWERLSRIGERVTFDLDRNSLERHGDTATILVRTSYFDESKAGRPLAPYLFFDQPYEFYCSERSFILLPSRSYTAATGKWRDWPGTENPRMVDVEARQNWQPELNSTNLRAFEIACAPSPRPRPRPGNRP